MPGPIPPHGFSNRNRVRHSAVGLKESLTPAVNRLTSTGVFGLTLCILSLNAVRTALLQVPPPGAAGLMDPGNVVVDP